MKKTFLIALSAMVMMSCSNSNNNKQQEVTEEVKQPIIAEVVEVVKYELPEDKYANKTIKVKGEAGPDHDKYYFEMTLHPNGYVTDHVKHHLYIPVRGDDKWTDLGEKKGTWSMYTQKMGANTVVVFEVAVSGNKHYFTEVFDYYYRSDNAYYDFSRFNTNKAFKITEHSVE